MRAQVMQLSYLSSTQGSLEFYPMRQAFWSMKRVIGKYQFQLKPLPRLLLAKFLVLLTREIPLASNEQHTPNHKMCEQLAEANFFVE